jgi:hypothetical protein
VIRPVVHATTGTVGARTLYFDIDGVLLDYEDRPKPALIGGVFERALQDAGFDRLVCVSGWAAMAAAPVLRIPIAAQGWWLHRYLEELFPSAQWFLDRLILCTDPDRRGWSIDTSGDWYYVDDWADEYFVAAHGTELYEAELGRHICRADPHSDGSDVLAWVRSI